MVNELLLIIAQIQPDNSLIPHPLYRWIIGTLLAGGGALVAAILFMFRYIITQNRDHKVEIIRVMAQHKDDILANSIKMTEATRDSAAANRELSESIKSIKDPIYNLVQNALKQ
jgi:hypothetical protein